MDDLQYLPISDAIRRCLIRYYSSYTEIFGEYCPLLVNSGALNPAFTAKQLKKALDYIGIKTNMASLYKNLDDPFNPVVNNVQNNPLLAQTTIFGTENGADAYYLRPRHETLDMIELAGYYRECEAGYVGRIPPPDIYEEALDEDAIDFVKTLYEQIRWRKHRKSEFWLRKFRYFTDFRDKTRTELDNSIVTKPSLFKLAMFEALVDEGEWSGWEIEQKTGIRKANVRSIVDKSTKTRDTRRVIVKADSYWDALEQVDEPGYAVQLEDGTYLVQLRALFRKKTALELEKVREPSHYSLDGTNMRDYRVTIPKEVSAPGFQTKFLANSLRQVLKEAGIEVPMTIIRVSDIIEHVRERGFA